MDVAVAVVLGVAFLFMFYRAVQADWPESYFGASDVSAFAISATPLRYLLFRFAPVYVTCLFVAVSLDRAGGPGSLGAFLVGTVHGVMTLGWALVVWARSEPHERGYRASISLLRLIVLAGLLGVSVIAIWTRQAFAPLVPPLTELSATLWTAVFAAVIGAFVVRISRGNALGEYDLAQRSLQSVPSKLLDLGFAVAKDVGADEKLVGALILVENIQRPAWFRSLERLKARLIKPGTYGIMQIRSDRALSDEESIRKTVTERLATVRVQTVKGDLDADALRAFAAGYNPGRNFAGLLTSAYILMMQVRKKPS